MADDTTRRRHLLTTTLVGALLPADVPEGRMMRTWLDSRTGVGQVVDAMHAQGDNAEWRGTFISTVRPSPGLTKLRFTFAKSLCDMSSSPSQPWLKEASRRVLADQGASRCAARRPAARRPG